MPDCDDIVREFLIESAENLTRLDQAMVSLEKQPKDAQLLASIFRTFHTIKGTCGFLGFPRLERLSHSAENVLSRLRDGRLELSAGLTTLLLQSVDVIKAILAHIESDGAEPNEENASLIAQLDIAAEGGATAPAEAPAEPAKQVAVEQPAPKTVAPEQPVAAAPPPPAPAPAPTSEGEPERAAPSLADSTIRVDVNLLDKLMNLVGELVLARNQVLQFNDAQKDSPLSATSQHLDLITTELQEGVMKTRMQPIGLVWNALPRLVRDLALNSGKQILLEMEGAGTELDKTIIEAIKDPLTHCVRNACDHGIERPEVRTAKGKAPQGKLSLRAFHEGGQVNIEIADDGGGIDLQRVREKALQTGLIRQQDVQRMSDHEVLSLIFLPGLSTAAKVTSVSGRGVGMDVVKTNIERIGGTVDVASVPGAGTTLKIKIPLTLAIVPGLVIASGGERFVIPQVSLLELIRIESDNLENQIERIHGAPVYRRRGSLLPIVYLNETLRLPAIEANQDAVNIVVVQVEDCQFGIVVDAISDTQEIVVKPVSKQLKGLNCYAGATIMGDGRVALILDVTGIGRRAGVVVESQQRKNASAENKEQTVTDLRTYLMFRAGDYERVGVPLSLVARLEEIPAGEVERAGSRIVVQYRGRILSLFSLAQLLNPASPPPSSDPLQVVVFDNGKRAFGLIVDQILDITEDSISAWEPSAIPGLLGSAVIGKRVTDILDLAAIIDSIDHRGASLGSGDGAPRARRARFEGPNAPRILLAGGTEFDRSLIRTRLELWGCQVSEATSDQDAFRLLAAASPDLILSGLEDSFAGRVHDVPGCTQIPIEPLDLGNSSLERLLHVLRSEPVSSQEVLA